MGTWGPGNFENDCAADHLYEICGPLLKEVEEAMQDPSSLEPDELYGDLVPATLELIACLSEHLGRYERGKIQDFLYPCVLPSPETVAEWKRTYLGVWEACIDGLDPKPDYKRQRREVLVATFDRVERLARGRYEGKDYPDVRSYLADQYPREDDKPSSGKGSKKVGKKKSAAKKSPAKKASAKKAGAKKTAAKRRPGRKSGRDRDS